MFTNQELTGVSEMAIKMTVSYTHLDVYKRQRLFSPLRIGVRWSLKLDQATEGGYGNLRYH